jgi:hypothetical protein
VGQFEFLRASERQEVCGTLRSSLDYSFPFDVGANAPDNKSADEADGERDASRND